MENEVEDKKLEIKIDPFSYVRTLRSIDDWPPIFDDIIIGKFTDELAKNGQKDPFKKLQETLEKYHADLVIAWMHASTDLGQLNKMSHLADSKRTARKALASAIKSLKKAEAEMEKIKADSGVFNFIYHALLGEREVNGFKGWHEIEKTLPKSYKFLDSIDKNIQTNSKRGRPDTIEKLTPFIGVVAKIYTEVSGKEFTFDKLISENGSEKAVSSGMRFCEIAMLAFQHHQKNFSARTFESACEIVRKEALLLR